MRKSYFIIFVSDLQCTVATIQEARLKQLYKKSKLLFYFKEQNIILPVDCVGENVSTV